MYKLGTALRTFQFHAHLVDEPLHIPLTSSPSVACLLAGLILAGAGCWSGDAEQDLVRVYDPRRSCGGGQATRADSILLERVLPAAARRYWTLQSEQEDWDTPLASCDENFQLFGATREGSFTRPGASERAILYSYCDFPARVDGSLQGIVVLDGGRLVAHHLGILGYSIYALPDINMDGRNEIVVANDSLNQGWSWEEIILIKVGAGVDAANDWGSFQVKRDNCLTLDERTWQDIHVVLARPGRTPQFFQQAYRGTCDPVPGGAGSWIQVGPLKPADAQL